MQPITLTIPPGAFTMVAPPPIRISQKTCEAITGLTRRQFLELLPAYEASGGEVIRVGRARLVEPLTFVAWLRKRAEQSGADEREEKLRLEELARGCGLRVVG